MYGKPIFPFLFWVYWPFMNSDIISRQDTTTLKSHCLTIYPYGLVLCLCPLP
jgi:hypothetical protein